MASRWGRRETVAAIALSVICLITMGQAVGYEFINYDDNSVVYENPYVSAGLTHVGLVWAFTSIDQPYWQPLTWVSHMLVCELFGLNSGAHHAVNLLLHIANSLLVFAVFRSLTGAFWRSVLLAALFAIHPTRVESVVWVTERKDLLSGIFFLATLWTYVRYVERPSAGRYNLVLLSLALGLMSKPMLVTVPLVLWLLDYWSLRRRAFAEKLPMLVLVAVSSVLSYLGALRISSINWGADLPLATRVTNALVGYVRYLKLILWPHDQAVLYPYPQSIPLGQALAAASFLMVITAAALWFGRRRPYLAVGWLWFAIGLGPVIGLVQVGRQSIADRFTYIPLIGLLLAVIWGLAEVFRARPRLAAALAIAVLGAYGVVTWRYTRTWHDSVTVFTQAVAVTENNSAAHHYLAAALEERGRFDEALPHRAEAVRIEPSYMVAQHSYGLALERRGDSEAAAEHFAAAIRYFPNYAAAHYHLGKNLARMGRVAEARTALERALEIGLDATDAADARRELAALPPTA